MNGDLLRIFGDALTTFAWVSGPLLSTALGAGIAIGFVQTVAQVNEASVSFLVKAMAVGGVLVTGGALMATHMTGFTHRCFEAIEHVVR